ncbi:MAG: right-handed parallel beta-helix repeat-containing protein [Actinomycetota bacterium]|nr:right-handed parallel beta-helix repeat-containing protein [Actinomycetota bacterium]
MTRVARTMSVCAVALLGMGMLTARVAAADEPCTHTINNIDDARAALNAAAPGDMLCFFGADLANVDLTLTRSGTAKDPIRLISNGHITVHQLHVLADHVIIQGFTIVGGGELLLAGTGIVAQKNTVHDTQRGGIICATCTDSIIESNTVTHAATTGISISGQRITVRENLVSGTVVGGDGDADGVRFFGSGLNIVSNSIWNIPATGSAAHPDCFQTFDTGHSATFDVTIVGNACRNVAENCLIATGDESGNSEAPAGASSITFIGNDCATNGDQAVYLRRWPNVDVRKNHLLGPNLKHGVLITNTSTRCIVKDNIIAGDVPPVQIDDSSRPGFNSPF